MEPLKLLHRLRPGRAIALAAAALAVAAPVASAGKPADKGNGKAKPAPEAVSPAAPCDDRVFSPVFAPWNDRALYTLAPGGDFETHAEGWTLSGPATVAADSAPFMLGAALGTGSLELPAGASALSPPICVKRGFPGFRFVTRSVAAGDLKVQVVYASGAVKGTGRLKPAAEWGVTRKLSLAQGRFRVKSGGSALIQLRFAATAGTVRVDDVYVDPRYHR